MPNTEPTELKLKAQRYLFLAGEGNQTATQHMENAPPQQCRPLQMTVVKFTKPYPFFAHCLDNGMNPRITITSHQSEDGKFIWYLGGQLAEDGAKRSITDQIAAAKKELATLFPWLDLSSAEWGSFYINRAEPKQPDGKRPDSPFLQIHQNRMVGWPTKLALSPLLVDAIINAAKEQNLVPSPASFSQDLTLLNLLPKPSIAKPVWEEIFNSSYKISKSIPEIV